MDLDDYEHEFLNMTEWTEDHQTYQTHPGVIFQAVLPTVIFCITMPANSFVLWVLWRERRWKTTCDILLLQLTVSNLLIIGNLPLLTCNLLYSWVFGLWTCILSRGVLYLGEISNPVILSVMALHCYVTVFGAQRLNAVVSAKTYVVIWLLCAGLSIKHAVYGNIMKVMDVEYCYFSGDINVLVSDIFITGIFFFIPFIGIAFCYIHMWISKKPLTSEGAQPPTKLILKIAVGLFICLAPHYISHFTVALHLLGARVHMHLHSEALAHIVASLAYFSCCVSPFFFIFGEQKFRKYLLMPCNKSSQGPDDSSVPFVILEEPVV